MLKFFNLYDIKKYINIIKCGSFFVLLAVILIISTFTSVDDKSQVIYDDSNMFKSDMRYKITIEEKLQKRLNEIKAQKAAEEVEQKKNEDIARYSNIWFCQFDDDFAWYGYGSDTIAGGGCGLCSGTVIIDCLLGRDLTPPEVSYDMENSFGGWGEYYLPGAGTIHAGMLEYFERQGLSAWRCDVYEAIDYVKTHKSDACIYISSRGPFVTNDGWSYWTGGHIVAAYYVDDDYVYVQDSGQWNTRDVIYSYDEFIELSYNANTIAVISR